MNKKVIIGGFVLLGIVLVVAVVVVLTFQRKQATATPQKLSVQANTISFYDGVFLSSENNIIHIRLSSSGAASDFYINESTQVMRQQAQGVEEKKKITDIPPNARVQVSVQENSPSSMTADKIIYRDSNQ